MRILGAMHHYLVPSLLMGFLLFFAGQLFCVFITLLVKREKVRVRILTCICQYIMCVYLVGVLFVTGGYQVFLNGLPEYTISPNLIPLRDTVQNIFSNPAEMAEQIGYNIVLFVPFGMLLPLSLPDVTIDWKRALLLSVLCVIIVESLELLSGRYFDIDDVIINSAGALLGFGIYRMLSKIKFSAAD